MGQENETNSNNNNLQEVKANEVDENHCHSNLSSLLASNNRDFLISPNGHQVKISDVQGKIVGVYFSANWYPPCQKFTPLLANAYEQLKDCDPSFEIVFVSSDEDLDAFKNYHASMPWLAIPFSDLDTRRALTRRFDVEGIPCLIILQPNSDGEDLDIRQDGVDLIQRYGIEAYPFTKEKLEELLEKERDEHEQQSLNDLLTNCGRDFLIGQAIKQAISSLLGKTVGLFFSAKWCPPGEKFTAKLASIYQKINQNSTLQRQEGFEIVFISCDYEQTAFNTYFQTMPWLALPFGDPSIKYLVKFFDVRDIPSLVIVGPNGKTVTKHGRNLVNLYQEKAYPFTKSRIDLLERQIDEESRELPKTAFHSGHHHELTLVSEGHGGGSFICCDCEEQGSGWGYLCMNCGYEVHPKCVKAVDQESAT